MSGVGIFNGTVDEIRKVMDEDPGVKAGIFVYEIHACPGFPWGPAPGRTVASPGPSNIGQSSPS